MQDSKLIVFEGCDQSGKTTAANIVAAKLMERQQQVLNLHYPGHPYRDIVLNGFKLSNRLDNPGRDLHVVRADIAIQVAYMAKHIQLIVDDILPFLADGGYVIMDRFWWSTYVQLRKVVSEPTTMTLLQPELMFWNDYLPIPALFFVWKDELYRANRIQEQVCPEQKFYNELFFYKYNSYTDIVNPGEMDAYRELVINMVIGD